MREIKRTEKKINFIYLLLLIILISIFLVSLYMILNWIYQTEKSKKVSANIIEQVIENPVNSEENSQELKIDFTKLSEINNQVVGWIKVENTDINYPIVKASDNDYYLHYDFFKQKSQNGWIFMDYRNKEDFIDNNTVIFGHNIKSGIMFSDLKKIYNGSIDKDSSIIIYNKSGSQTKYNIYSCYMEEPDNMSINPYIANNQYVEFVNQMKKKSRFNYSVNSNYGKTITLSTCDSTGEKRILIHAMVEK